MRCTCATLLLLSSFLRQETVVVAAQDLNANDPEDTDQPFVGFVTSFDLASVESATFDSVSIDNATFDMDPLVLVDSPSTNDTDTTTNMTNTIMDETVPALINLTDGTVPSMWEKPKWWNLYRKKFKTPRLRKCLFLDGVVPVNGTTCPPIGNSSSYMCMFGDNQICDASTDLLPGLFNGFTGASLGSVHPTVNCMCRHSLWHCADWAPCATNTTNPANDTTSGITSCPDTRPIRSLDICASDLECAYGNETCCGQTFDNLICQCLEGTTFFCYYTDACLLPSCGTEGTADPLANDTISGIMSCPDTRPIRSLDICASDLECAYGNETCCGQTFDNLVCQCSAGEKFVCYYTDACYRPFCGTEGAAQEKSPTNLGNGTFCPIAVPISGDACPTGLDTSIQCAYGTVCCCGQCFDETTCSCNGSASNLFECSTIAIACSSTCPVDTLAPPECPVDEPQNGDKCFVPDQTCEYGRSLLLYIIIMLLLLLSLHSLYDQCSSLS